MKLCKTKKFMDSLIENRDLDSYAILVCSDGEKSLLTSSNVNEDTYFDVASMSKVLVTSTLILQAADNGLIALDDTLDKFFENVPEEKQKITIKQLLTHTSGIIRHEFPAFFMGCDKEIFSEYILDCPLAYSPGSDCRYSCDGYILLGFVVEKVYKMPLDEAFYKYMKEPLSLTRSRFNIATDEENAAICYTRKDVNALRADDGNAYVMGGVAGNAASFWSIADIEKFVDALMEKSEKLFSAEMHDLAEKNHTSDFEEGRGLGYLVVNEKYSQAGELFTVGSFGHCGHTGTSFFINREKKLYAIVLTNASRFQNMKNNFSFRYYSNVKKIRREIHNAIASDLKEIR